MGKVRLVQSAEKHNFIENRASSRGSDGFEKVRAFLALTLVYLTYSRLPEFLPIPGLALISAVGGFVLVFLSGNLEQAVKSRVGMGLIALTGVICLGIPFSVWPGGAFHSLRNDWLKQVLIYYILVGGVITNRECKKAVYMIAFATATIIGLTFRHGTVGDDGRLVLGLGTLGNANYLAMYLVIGAPFCFYALRNANVVLKLFWLVILVYIAKDVLATGSRAALLGGAAGAIYVFAKSTMFQRALALASVLVLALAVTAFVPGKVLERYNSIFSSSEGAPQNAAEGSKEARIEILKRSLIATATHPILGVGLGQFGVENMGMTSDLGSKADFHSTHNMYTQVSSELGIPAFILYVSLLVFSFRSVGKVMRQTRNDATAADTYALAYTVRVACVVFFVTGVFANVAFSIPLLTMLGLTEIIRRAVLTPPSAELVGQLGIPAIRKSPGQVGLRPQRQPDLRKGPPIFRSKQSAT